MVTDKFKPSHGPVKFNNTSSLTFSPFPKVTKVSNSLERTTRTKEKQVRNVKEKKQFKSTEKVGNVTQSFSDSNLLTHKLTQSPSPATGAARRGRDSNSSQKKLRKPSVSLSETQQQFNPNQNFDSRGGTAGKISTNSTRLIQQFPHKFCSNDAELEVKGPKSSSKHNGQVIEKCVKDTQAQVVPQGPQVASQGPQVPSQGPQEDFTENVIMLASDSKRPLTLMEQKKLQWAREREELNGLWSPWGRPLSNTSRPPISGTSTYVNKHQTSTIQSEYHLPPIANNNLTSPASRQAQLKSTLWTCDESMRVNGRSTLPICINATTGEVLYSKGGPPQDDRDTLHVNNVVISNNNGSLHNALNIKALKYGNHKRHHQQQQQSSSHSASSNHCWSSVDEEAFTSGYHSEVNGSSNGEEYGSRKGSGSDGSKDGRGGPNVIVHNIQIEPKLEVPGGHESKLERSSRVPHNPPPAAMRSSITVGLDSSTAQPDAYKELQKLERERWLQELEKQREEQRLRKQQEKDEKRPKWGDKGIGVGHFWEPSNSTDHLPQPSRDDASPASPPAWLEKGLSRLQNSVSQPSLYDAAHAGDSEFQGPPNTGSLFTNQSTMDLRNVAGMEECERNYLRGNAASADSEMTVDADKKRREAVEHQAAIRKQIEERQQRLKEERERRLQEELKDEETAKLHRLRELEHIELEARRMGMAMQSNQSEESEEPPDLGETKDIRKILDDKSSDGRISRETARSAASQGRRRQSLETETPAHIESKVSTPIPQYLTSSQSMVNISTGTSKKNAKSEPEDMGYPSNNSLHRSEEGHREKERQGSHRSRSLSSHRSFGTQTESEAAAAAAAQKKNSNKHRSHNCLVKGSEEDSPDAKSDAKKKLEKPRWGATQSKKQYMKQSEKDPMYQQRLKRRVERIKKMEERNGSLAPAKTADTGTGTESEDPVPSRGRARSPRSRNRQNHGGANAAASEKSPKKQVPLKATARIQVSHHHKPATPPEEPSNRKLFPDIPGRTIGPLNSASHGPDFDNFNKIGSRNSSRFSSPSLESISSRNHIESHHYVRQRVTGDGDAIEVDLESRISTRSLEIHYEDQLKSSQQSKKTIIESSSDEITYRKTTVINQISSRIPEEEAIGSSNPGDRNSGRSDPNCGQKDSNCGRMDQNLSRKDSNCGRMDQNSNRTEQNFGQMDPNFGQIDQNQHRKSIATDPPSTPLKTSTPKHTPNEPKPRFKPEPKPRRPPPKNISSTDRDPEDPEEVKAHPPEILPKKKKGTRTPAARPISNPLINASPLASPVPNIIPYPTRMGSPPVPAVLKKLQAGIPIEDLPVCDDPLYEVPRAQTAGSTSNGYKSVESDSSQSNPPPLMSRFSSDAGLEIDIDPSYVLSSIRIHAQSPEEGIEEDSFDRIEGTKSEEDEEYQAVLREALEDRRIQQDPSEEDTEKPSEDDEEDYDDGKTTDGYDEPIYPYPIPRISPRLKSQHSLISPPMSPLIPRLSGRTTTLEVMADYRKFTLPDYDFDNVKLFPHVDVDGLDVTAAVQNIRRPGTQDTDLSKREKLISYVINNRDVQAQISARDSELSEKGIIEFNVRLPVHEDEEYGGDSGGDFEDDYKDPLLSDRQRATIRWLYSSDGSSSNSKDSVLTHLSYLKKGIQQQQQEWNVLPSDTDETDSYNQHNYSGSTNENSSDECKYFKS